MQWVACGWVAAGWVAGDEVCHNSNVHDTFGGVGQQYYNYEKLFADDEAVIQTIMKFVTGTTWQH
jgi:hypothetical protein